MRVCNGRRRRRRPRSPSASASWSRWCSSSGCWRRRRDSSSSTRRTAAISTLPGDADAAVAEVHVNGPGQGHRRSASRARGRAASARRRAVKCATRSRHGHRHWTAISRSDSTVSCAVTRRQSGRAQRARRPHGGGASRLRRPLLASRPDADRRRDPPPHARCTTRHARPAPSSCRSPAGRCRSSTTGIREEHLAVRSGAGVFDVSHMGEIETARPAGRRVPPAPALQRRRARSPSAARSTACCAARTAACSTTSSPTAWPSDRYLTVTNAANHEQDLAWFQQPRRAASTSTSIDRADDYAMLAVQGPDARDDRRRARRRRAARRAARTASARVAGVRRARLRHRLHRRGRRRAAARRPSDAEPSGTRCSAAGATPVGLGARDTLRLEVCFHLYGNDLMEERGPIEAGLGLVLQGGHRLHRLRGGRAPPARPGPPRSSCPFVLDRPGHRPPGQPGRRRRRGDERHAVAVPGRSAIGMAYVPADRAEPGTAIEIDVRGKVRARARSSDKPLYRQGDLTSGRRELPRRPAATTPSTTGPASTATIATFGITWYAQDALGEVVFFDPPEVGATVTKDEPYAEVESVKAVSDVDRAAVRARSSRSTRRCATRPRRSTTTPTARAGWSRSRLSDPSRGRTACMDAGDLPVRTRLGAREPLHLRHRRRPPRDARRDRRRSSVDELFADIPEGVRLGRALDLPAGQARAGGLRAPARPGGAATSPPRTS